MCTSSENKNKSSSNATTTTTMLTSTTANQYLRPEYLPPVSSPLDANKSPLALLAKTCSSIGVDTPSLKSLTSSSSSSSSSTSSSSSNNDPSSSSTISTNHRRSTPKTKPSTDYILDSSSNKLNFKPYESSTNHHRSKLIEDKSSTSPGKSTPSKVPSPDHQKHHHSSSSAQPLSYTSLGLPDMHKDSLAAFYKAYGFLAPNCCPTTTPGSPYPSLMPPPIALDKTGAYPSIYPPTPPATAAAALAAYNYSQRLKGMIPSGAGNPLCRDPYCAGQCGPLHNSHHHLALLAASASTSAPSGNTMANLRDSNGGQQHPATAVNNNTTQCTPATCPNGCNQCEHQRYLATLAAVYGNSFAALGGFVPSPTTPQVAAAASSYASSLAAAAALQHHRMAAAAMASTTGNVCNWIIGDNHCGKRFNTSEELLQHLKTHTNSASPESVSSTITTTNNNNASSNSSSSSNHHSPTSVTVAPSGTPSPSARVAPNSGSSSATSPTPGHHHHNNRYHPYSKPGGSSTATTSTLPPTLPQSLFGLNGSTTAVNGLPYHLNSSPFGTVPTPANFYYPFMTPPNFLAGRIGPPVPP